MENEKTLREILNRIESLEARVGRIESTVTETERPKKKSVSIREFLLSLPKGNYTKNTLRIGYFLEIFEGEKEFDINKLRSAFRKAKEKTPPNLSEAVRQNVIKGFFMEVGKNEEGLTTWGLTNSGITEVETKHKEGIENA